MHGRVLVGGDLGGPRYSEKYSSVEDILDVLQDRNGG